MKPSTKVCAYIGIVGNSSIDPIRLIDTPLLHAIEEITKFALEHPMATRMEFTLTANEEQLDRAIRVQNKTTLGKTDALDAIRALMLGSADGADEDTSESEDS